MIRWERNSQASFLCHLIPYPDQPRRTDLGTLAVLFHKGEDKTRQTNKTRLMPFNVSVTCIKAGFTSGIRQAFLTLNVERH